MGNIRIIDFSYTLRIINMDFKGINIHNDQIISKSVLPKIKVNGTHPINIVFPYNLPYDKIKDAQVFIRYNYSIPIFKFHFKDSVKFVLQRDYLNKFNWIEYQY